jgi:ribose 5-phosphate isomerase B
VRIAIGCDHNGLDLKEALTPLLRERGHQVQDVGCFSPSAVDYPDIAQQVAQAVARGECQQGLLICATGIGMSIAANKVPGIRAALCSDPFSAQRAREHNDANVLCLGGLVTRPELAREILLAYLDASFEGGRHARRVDKIQGIEQTTERVR